MYFYDCSPVIYKNYSISEVRLQEWKYGNDGLESKFLWFGILNELRKKLKKICYDEISGQPGIIVKNHTQNSLKGLQSYSVFSTLNMIPYLGSVTQ